MEKNGSALVRNDIIRVVPSDFASRQHERAGERGFPKRRAKQHDNNHTSYDDDDGAIIIRARDVIT